MRKLFLLALVALVGGAVVASLPDIKRYIEISRM